MSVGVTPVVEKVIGVIAAHKHIHVVQEQGHQIKCVQPADYLRSELTGW